MLTQYVEIKTNNDRSLYRKEWILTNWLEKTCFVIGVISTAILVISFLVGFIEGLIS